MIRVARHATGREIVLVFDGKYHGHGDATLVVLENGEVVPEYDGLAGSIPGQTRVVRFNDVDALERALAPRDVAVVLAEPAMTNAGFILPVDGFHEHLRRLTRDSGTLLALDETHSLVCAYGGFARLWDLEPDFLTLGKSIAAGVPLGAYGMTDPVASVISPPEHPNVVAGAIVSEVATGGTLFANSLSLAAGHAALTQVLTEEAFERTAVLGARMAEGLRAVIDGWKVPWSVTGGGSCLLLLRARSSPRRSRLPSGRRPRSSGTDTRVYGESRRLGVGLVVGPHALGLAQRAGRAPVSRRVRRVPRGGNSDEPVTSWAPPLHSSGTRLRQL